MVINSQQQLKALYEPNADKQIETQMRLNTRSYVHIKLDAT